MPPLKKPAAAISKPRQTSLELIMLCGLPGSGKSTFTREFQGPVVSTDAIREMVTGDAANRSRDSLVFKLAQEMLAYYLFRNISVMYDATNLLRSSRRRIIALGRRYNARIRVIWIDCPPELAIRRNLQRKRQVPAHVIRRMHRQFQPPSPEEGIAAIERREVCDTPDTPPSQ